MIPFDVVRRHPAAAVSHCVVSERSSDMGKQEYERKLKAQLTEWEADINRLRAKADAAQAEAKVKYLEEIEELRAQKKKAEARLDELEDASEDAWEDLKGGIDTAWKNLGNAVSNAVDRFK